MNNLVLLKHNKNWGLSEERVLFLAEKELKKFGFERDTELSLLFVGRTRAKSLNQKYRKKDYIPQVLGFPMEKNKGADGIRRLGDVVICTQKLKYESRFQKRQIDGILGDWIRHGIENLLA